MMKNLFGSLFLLVVLALPMLAQTPAVSTRVAGKIFATHVHGGVTAKNTVTGETVTLHDNDTLTEKYVVTTAKDAAVILMFENGATISMADDSELNIDEFQRDPFSGPVKLAELKAEPSISVTKLNMTRGELVGKVVHLNVDGGSEFTVATPVGAAGIRGTTFQITFRPDGHGGAIFRLVTADGRVLFGKTALPVIAGKEISVAVNLSTDNATGTVSATVSSNSSLTVNSVSAADLAVITAVTQTIVQAITTTTITLTSTPTGSTTTGTTTGTPSSTPSANTNTPALPPAPALRTTNGDGTG